MIISLFCITTTAFASDKGIGLRLGAAQNDPKTMETLHDQAVAQGNAAKKTKNNMVFGIEAFEEWNLSDETNKIGVKLGIEGYGQNKLSVNWGDGKLTETTYAIPTTVYYKKDHGLKNWSWFAGAGFTFIRTEIKGKAIGYEDKWEKSKVFPHVTVGTEYRFSEKFALGLDLKYNIAAKVKKDINEIAMYNATISDRSGIGGAITARFYF